MKKMKTMKKMKKMKKKIIDLATKIYNQSLIMIKGCKTIIFS